MLNILYTVSSGAKWEILGIAEKTSQLSNFRLCIPLPSRSSLFPILNIKIFHTLSDERYLGTINDYGTMKVLSFLKSMSTGEDLLPVENRLKSALRPNEKIWSLCWRLT